jgi:hypothetical protein
MGCEWKAPLALAPDTDTDNGTTESEGEAQAVMIDEDGSPTGTAALPRGSLLG